MYEFDLAAICRVDGCTKDDLHLRHKLRAKCQNPSCESGGGAVLRMSNPDGSLTCKSCSSPMRIDSRAAEDISKTGQFRDIVGRCVGRLKLLKGLPVDMKVRCPWNDAFDGCGGNCRCHGTKYITAGLLVLHYKAMIIEFDRETSAFDEAILDSISLHIPKRFAELYRDVEENYGKVSVTKQAGVRKLYHHLNALLERGRMLRIDLGENLYAYLHPNSPVAKDHGFLRDFMSDRLPSSDFYHDKGEGLALA